MADVTVAFVDPTHQPLTNLELGDVYYGDSATKSFLIELRRPAGATNTPLELKFVWSSTAPGSDKAFSWSPTTLSVDANASWQPDGTSGKQHRFEPVTVTFTPAKSNETPPPRKTFFINLAVCDSATIPLGSVRVSGTGCPLLIDKEKLDFGTQPVGDKDAKTFTVTNGSEHAATVSFSDGGAFSIAGIDDLKKNKLAGAAGSTPTAKTLEVVFSPTKPGTFNGSVEFKIGNATEKLTFTGKAVAQDATGAGTSGSASGGGAAQSDKLDYVSTSSDPSVDTGSSSTTATTALTPDKYWEVELDYPGLDGKKINSYLRIGTAETNPLGTNNATALAVESENYHRGHDLASLLYPYYDDVRDRGGSGAAHHFLTPAERAAETAKLHVRGGWRDHSDGNRITTTRGDKLEVIRGNYQVLVLGRQDQRGEGTRQESGGGHYVQDPDCLTPGAIQQIAWKQDSYDGTWKCTEETTKGDFLIRYHGDYEEHHYGKKRICTIGAEDAGAPLGGWISDPSPNKKINPEITEKTWAKKIESHTGSAGCPVPEIKEITWTNLMISNTNVLGACIENTNIAGLHMDTTHVGGLKLDELGVAGLFTEITMANYHLAVELSGCLDIFIGVKIDMPIGGYTEIATWKTEIAATQTDIAADSKEISASDTDITATKQEVAAQTTEVAAEQKIVAANSTEVAASKKSVAASTDII